MLKGKVLSGTDIEQFMEHGWVRVPLAYSRKAALAAQEVLWEQVEKRGAIRSDPSTWTQPMIQINENYDTPEFRACDTERLSDAIEDLVGIGRWIGRGTPNRWGWWPVNFAKGAQSEWDVPKDGWHWDGIHFRHHVNSPEQGLLCLCMFSDIGKHGGGTVIAEGSHKVVARFLATQPEGIELGEGIRTVNQGHEWFRKLTGQYERESDASNVNRVDYFMHHTFVDADGISLRVSETTAEAGDVILCHPFLYHAASQNLSGVPRFMCNRTTPLHDRMNLNRSVVEDYSPLELSIRNALS